MDPLVDLVVQVVLVVLVQLVAQVVLAVMVVIQEMLDKMVKLVMTLGNHKVVMVAHQAVVLVVEAVIGLQDQEQVLAVAAVADPH